MQLNKGLNRRADSVLISCWKEEHFSYPIQAHSVLQGTHHLWLRNLPWKATANGARRRAIASHFSKSNARAIALTNQHVGLRRIILAGCVADPMSPPRSEAIVAWTRTASSDSLDRMASRAGRLVLSCRACMHVSTWEFN